MRKWIKGAIKRPGALRKALGTVKGKIPVSRIRAAAKKAGRLGRQARLALTLRGFSRPSRAAKARGRRKAVRTRTRRRR